MRLPRKQLLITLAVVVSSALGVAVVAPWVAKRAIGHVAQTKGWSVALDGGRIGWRGVWFRRIVVDARQGATLHAELGPLRVGWSSLFGTRRLSIGSGTILLTGTVDEVRALFNRNRQNGSSRAVRRREFEYDLHRIDLDWREVPERPPIVSARGMELDGDWDQVTASLDTLTATHGAIGIELKAARVESAKSLDRSALANTPPESRAGWLVAGARAAEILVKYDASARLVGQHDTAVESRPPERAPSDDTPAPKRVSSAQRNSAPPKSSPNKPRALGATPTATKRELLPALGSLFDEIEQLRGALAKSVGAEAGSVVWDGIGIGSRLESDALRMRITDGGQKLDLGPWPFKVARGETSIDAELAQVASSGKPSVSARLTIQNGFERGTLAFSAGPISLTQLGVTEGDFGLEHISDTRLELDARALLALDEGELSIETKGWVERLSIHQPYLARETIRNVAFKWEGSVAINAAKRQLKTELLRLSAGPVSARLKGTVSLAASHQTIDGVLEVPLAACQDLFDVLPEGFAPLLRGWRLDHSFAMRLTTAFDSRKPDKSAIGFRLDNHCRVKSVPIEVSPSRFEQPFVLEVEDEQGVPQATSFGPGTWGWTPLSAVSPYIESAVMVCEDGRFLTHDGFDREAIQNSIRENLRTLRFARGASTVSMQLAKNLYLRRDKTVARKLQEAALTMLLEQSFSKRQLLELYLNVIEFGPGIYGIGPASRHYFASTPDRLTLAQSFFLMSILPNPKPSHFGADGALHPGWMKLLRSLMVIAHRRGHFSQAELDAGLEERLVFRVPGVSSVTPTRRMLQELGADPADELLLPPTAED